MFVKMGVALAIVQATWDILNHAANPELSAGWLGSFVLFILGGMIFITNSLNDYYQHHERK